MTVITAAIAVFLVVVAAVARVGAQLPVPSAPPGFVYGGGAASARVQLESYIDLLCPFSKAALPVLREVVGHYRAEDVRLKFVLFPLPYHQHAFTAAESMITITDALGDEAFPKWMEAIYAHQDAFGNKRNKDRSAVEVTDAFFTLAKKTFPQLTKEQWAKGMTGFGGTDADSETRTWWKYTCSRGITGTPSYTLNGVPFSADSDWTLRDWRKVLDPLVATEKGKGDEGNDDAAAVERQRH